jgi:hypothetical protein
MISKPQPREREIAVEIVRAKPEQQESPKEFVEVTRSQATPEPPKEARYYSANNSRAANRDTKQDSNVPRIDGTQERVAKTATTPREQAMEQPKPLLNSPNVETKAIQPNTSINESREKASVLERAQDLKLAKVKESVIPLEKKPVVTVVPQLQTPAVPTQNKSEHQVRPRKLAAVARKASESVMPGEAMKQPGGIKRYGLESSLDVRSTEFGAYDAAIIAAIQKRWYDLLDDRDLPRGEVGRVVLQFRLRSDGRITDMREVESDVSSTLGWMCRRAVEEPAPYAEWPSDLRRLVGKDYREVRFVFHYN